MFKIPDWEDDVPKRNANFTRKSKMKELRTQKPSTKTNKNHKHKNPKNNSNKSPIFNHKQYDKIQKTQNKRKESSQTHNKMLKSDVIDSTKKLLRNKVRSNGLTVKNFHMKQEKNKTNNEMINKRIQNKLAKANKNLKSMSDNKKLITNKFVKLQNTKNSDNEKVNKVDEKLKNAIPNRRLNNNKDNIRKRQITESDGLDIQNFNSDKLNEIVINAKKKKLNESLKNDDENELIHEIEKPKMSRKKEVLRKLLETNSRRNHIEVKGSKLRERMLDRLKAAQFRYLNEKLYTSSGSDAQQLFQSDPAAFQTYHQGYQQQVKKWPINPLDVIVKKIVKMPKIYTIADMGCGEAALSKRVPHKVRSFDLVASAPNVEACDMAHTPLLAESVDVAVYCLALMGTDLTQYLIEANRVLKIGGHLLMAEVESRFEDVESFTKEVQRLGFKLKNLDKSHEVFFFMEFTKIRVPPTKKSKLPVLTLKPCLYKRR